MGGAIFQSNGGFTIDKNTKFQNNSAMSSGGALQLNCSFDTS